MTRFRRIAAEICRFALPILLRVSVKELIEWLLDFFRLPPML